MRILWILTFLTLALSAQSQTVEQPECKEIVKAIKEADINELSSYLAGTVECDIFGKSNVCSKPQTVQIMRDFFDQNKPKQFVINHQVPNGQTKFIIGTYTSVAGKKYRISCTVKQNLITQIRIENAT